MIGPCHGVAKMSILKETAVAVERLVAAFADDDIRANTGSMRQKKCSGNNLGKHMENSECGLTSVSKF